MTAYAVFLREETLNQTELDTYAAKVGESWPALQAFSPELLAAYGAQEVVEGADVVGVVLVKFPTYELARQWYHSPAYKAIVRHRLNGGRYRGIIFDGLDSGTNDT